jgi:hypothetical protein
VRLRGEERLIGDAVDVLPFRGLGREKRADGLPVGGVWLLPVFLDRVPTGAQALLVGVAVLRDDRRDPLRPRQREPEADRRAVVENVDGVAAEADRVGEPLDDLRQVVEGVVELPAVRASEKPKPGRSGATMWKRSASSGIRLRNMCDELGKPWSSSRLGSSGSPASR